MHLTSGFPVTLGAIRAAPEAQLHPERPGAPPGGLQRAAWPGNGPTNRGHGPPPSRRPKIRQNLVTTSYMQCLSMPVNRPRGRLAGATMTCSRWPSGTVTSTMEAVVRQVDRQRCWRRRPLARRKLLPAPRGSASSGSERGGRGAPGPSHKRAQRARRGWRDLAEGRPAVAGATDTNSTRCREAPRRRRLGCRPREGVLVRSPLQPGTYRATSSGDERPDPGRWSG